MTWNSYELRTVFSDDRLEYQLIYLIYRINSLLLRLNVVMTGIKQGLPSSWRMGKIRNGVNRNSITPSAANKQMVLERPDQPNSTRDKLI